MTGHGEITQATTDEVALTAGHTRSVPNQQSRQVAQGQQPGSPKTILVIDDLPEIRELVSAMLHADDYNVITADNGPSGLRALDEHEPDLVILDHMMPHMKGMEVLTTLRGAGMTVPVILLTAFGNDDDLAWAYWKAGVSLFMDKPFEMRTLLRWVGDFLGQAHNPDEVPVFVVNSSPSQPSAWLV